MFAYAGIAVVGLVFVFVSNTFSRLEFSDRIVLERQLDLAGRFDELIGRLDALEERVTDLQSAPEPSPPTPTSRDTLKQTDSTMLTRLDALEDSAAALREDLHTIRTVLNPTDPTEVLTVLRLGDKFELLTNELDSIRTNIDDVKLSVDQRIQQNYQSTINHVDAVTSTIGWMALLLVPMLLNALREFLPRKSPDAAGAPAGHDHG